MKAVLNVDGKKLEVASIGFDNGEIVTVTTWSRFDKKAETYYDANCTWVPVGAEVLYLNELLEYPTIEQIVSDKWTSLIDHLEEVVADENNTLVNLAIDAMEDSSGLPFSHLSLIDKQKEYKLMSQRVLGVIDTVEEVKAFMEGWYADDDVTTANETEVANQTT